MSRRLTTIPTNTLLEKSHYIKREKENDNVRSSTPIASWQTQISTRLDQSALKREGPETFGRYLKESKSRPFRLNK
jgi:hypothetical protein